MKKAIFIVAVIFFAVLMGVLIMQVAGCRKKDRDYSLGSYEKSSKVFEAFCKEVEKIVEEGKYDPNDPAYKFIPAAPKEWTDKFGDNERTRLIHSISELRVVVAAQSKRILELEEWKKEQPKFGYTPQDINEVVQLMNQDPNGVK